MPRRSHLAKAGFSAASYGSASHVLPQAVVKIVRTKRVRRSLGGAKASTDSFLKLAAILATGASPSRDLRTPQRSQALRPRSPCSLVGRRKVRSIARCALPASPTMNETTAASMRVRCSAMPSGSSTTMAASTPMCCVLPEMMGLWSVGRRGTPRRTGGGIRRRRRYRADRSLQPDLCARPCRRADDPDAASSVHASGALSSSSTARKSLTPRRSRPGCRDNKCGCGALFSLGAGARSAATGCAACVPAMWFRRGHLRPLRCRAEGVAYACRVGCFAHRRGWAWRARQRTRNRAAQCRWHQLSACGSACGDCRLGARGRSPVRPMGRSGGTCRAPHRAVDRTEPVPRHAMTSRYGNGCSATSTPSCRSCSGRARSRATRRTMPISSNATLALPTQADIDRGVVNILVGFAPVKPAKFVVISLQQIARRCDCLSDPAVR